MAVEAAVEVLEVVELVVVVAFDVVVVLVVFTVVELVVVVAVPMQWLDEKGLLVNEVLTYQEYIANSSHCNTGK